MGRILAIDYGHKRTGLAVTDELQIIATALATVATADIFTYLKDYVTTHSVDCIVVGEPKQMNNTPSESAVYTEPFVKKLKSTFPDILVERVDERFTSLMATRAIRESGTGKKERQNKGIVDRVSATLILQSYMEQKHFSKTN